MTRRGGPLVLPHEKQRKLDQQRERRQAQRSTNSEVTKATAITQAEIRALEKAQDFRCAICSKHQSQCKTRLAVDHDHQTGKVRGLLCYSCNTKLAFVEKYLFRIIEYLGGKPT